MRWVTEQGNMYRGNVTKHHWYSQELPPPGESQSHQSPAEDALVRTLAEGTPVTGQ